MKRGLKAIGKQWFADRGGVEDPSPMKRGLKGIKFDGRADLDAAVEDPSPMKRGLKAIKLYNLSGCLRMLKTLPR